MNELIEQLWKHFMCNPLVDGGYTKKDGFKQAIQEACKAQSNACARVYEDYGDANEIGYNKSKIKSAEIRKEDYE